MTSLYPVSYQSSTLKAKQVSPSRHYDSLSEKHKTLK